MAICPCCALEMLDGVSCNAPIVVAGQAYDPIPWGSEIPPRSELHNLRRWRQFATAPCVETPPGGIRASPVVPRPRRDGDGGAGDSRTHRHDPTCP